MPNENTQTQQGTQGTQGTHEGAESAANATGGASPAQDQERDEVDQVNDVQALRHEAASRRRQLRTVEAENVALRERIDARDRAEVEAIASSSLADPSDFTAAVALDDLRGDDGAVDLEAVEASIGELLKAKPHFALNRTAPDLHQGYREPEPAPGPSFGQALKGGR
jgi:hypothetical protein